MRNRQSCQSNAAVIVRVEGIWPNYIEQGTIFAQLGQTSNVNFSADELSSIIENAM